MSRVFRSGAALLFFGLFGCGGGGGGGGGGGSSGLTPPPSTPIAISAANSTQVTDAALLPIVGGADVLGLVAAAETTTAAQPRALTRTLQRVARHAKESLTAPQTVVGVTETCLGGGTITFNESPDGSSGSIVFSACSEGGQTINGSFSFSGAAATSTSFQASFSIDITITETGVAPLRMAGNFSLSENCNGGDCNFTFTGSSLGALFGAETWFISNFTITEVNVGSAITITALYTVSSSDLNGSVTVSTSPSISLVSGAFPHAGVVDITGANGTKARLTISSSNPVDTQAVRMDIDVDNDGFYDDGTTFFSWNQLESA